jgi:hypothetical protein
MASCLNIDHSIETSRQGFMMEMYSMNKNQPMTKEHFIKRLGDLCLKSGLSGFPKDETDQHILLKSVILMIGHSGSFNEKEINDRLDIWVREISQIKNLDRVTLRRRLVDTGYLTRKKDGSSYQVSQPGPRPGLFEEAINQLNIPEVIATLREDIARRRKEYLEKSRGA